ncbi:hypothetical protein D3C71_1240930 [compost metagenome]
MHQAGLHFLQIRNELPHAILAIRGDGRGQVAAGDALKVGFDLVQRASHEQHYVAVAQQQQQQADAQHGAHADIGLLALGGGVFPQLRFAVLCIGFVVFHALAERAAGRHHGGGGVLARTRDVACFQVLALHGDAAVDQCIKARLHGLKDGGGSVLGGQFNKDGLLLARFGKRGVDAAAFFGRLGGLAFGGIFQLPRQAQAGAHDLVVDPG